jgi:hypothetical protein
MHSKNLLKELAQRDRRREAVLVFRGTGFNIWHYFPFLRNFSLKELSEFQALYAISGASLLLWLYCLMERGMITSSVAAEYDVVMRKSPRYGLLRRTARLLAGRHPYSAGEFMNVLRGLAPSPASEETLGQLPLERLSFVAQDESRKQLLVLNPECFPSLSIGEVISRVVTRSNIFGRPFCYRTPYCGMLIGDFDFADKRVKNQFREYLRDKHPRAPIYQINLFRTSERKPDRFVRICYDRFPRLWQVIDFGSFYFGIPNRRYLNTASRTLSV